MAELRKSYHEHLSALEDTVVAMGDQVLDMLSEAMAALVDADSERASAVIRADERVDERYHGVQQQALQVMALQAPVASELRLITALFHVNIHLERVGGLCVNLSKVAQDSGPPSDEPELTAHLQEMAVHARTVLAKAVEALTRRDRDAAYELPRLDDPLDQLNASVFRRLVHMAAADEARMNRAMRLVLVARYLERIGDHGVDIGEQVVFAVTGQSVELESEPA